MGVVVVDPMAGEMIVPDTRFDAFCWYLKDGVRILRWKKVRGPVRKWPSVMKGPYLRGVQVRGFFHRVSQGLSMGNFKRSPHSFQEPR